MVAGKSAKFATNATKKFIAGAHSHEAAFDFTKRLIKDNILLGYLRACKVGNYTKVNKAFRELVEANLDLLTCTVEQLEAIHGIGPKTARFFIMWTRGEQNLAALDVHVLRWLAYLGYDVPAQTPTGAKYMEIQTVFLNEAEARGMGARELDAKVWEYCSQGGHKDGEWPAELKRSDG